MSSLVDRLIRHIASALASLERAFLQLTRPSRYGVLLGSALDFTRSHAELVAENALLRLQLVILHRQVNKPRFTPTDRPWLVLLASRVRRWKEAILILQARYAPALASPRLPAVLEVQGSQPGWAPPGRLRNHHLDPADDQGEQSLGRGAYPWRVLEARYPGCQDHDPEVHPPGTPPSRPWSELVNLPQESRPDGLGV